MIIPQNKCYKADSKDKDCNRYTKFLFLFFVLGNLTFSKKFYLQFAS